MDGVAADRGLKVLLALGREDPYMITLLLTIALLGKLRASVRNLGKCLSINLLFCD